MSNFTWLLYLSFILQDFYIIKVQFKLTTCIFTWLHFWRKKTYFLLLTIISKHITFLFYLMHIKYGKWKLKSVRLTWEPLFIESLFYNARLSSNKNSDENVNIINIFLWIIIKCYKSPKKYLNEHWMFT